MQKNAEIRVAIVEDDRAIREGLGLIINAWDLQAAPELEDLKLTPEQRRQVFLIGKEAIHNIVKHSGCTVARLAMGVTDRQLWLEIADDGRGFPIPPTPEAPSSKRSGRGLASMQARAAQLGGALIVDSTPGQGTRLRLRIPL